MRKALRDVFADTKEQRCWWHNVLAALPKSAHKDAQRPLSVELRVVGARHVSSQRRFV